MLAIPQQSIPVTIDGHPYLVEMDEFSRGTSTEPDAPVGAAADHRHRRRDRLLRRLGPPPRGAPAREPAEQMDDPLADSSLRGYAGHYCVAPTRDEPKIAACSFILSGLRVFDITDPENLTEITYFNPPGVHVGWDTGQDQSLPGPFANSPAARSVPQERRRVEQ